MSSFKPVGPGSPPSVARQPEAARPSQPAVAPPPPPPPPKAPARSTSGFETKKTQAKVALDPFAPSPGPGGAQGLGGPGFVPPRPMGTDSLLTFNPDDVVDPTCLDLAAREVREGRGQGVLLLEDKTNADGNRAGHALVVTQTGGVDVRNPKAVLANADRVWVKDPARPGAPAVPLSTWMQSQTTRGPNGLDYRYTLSGGVDGATMRSLMAARGPAARNALLGSDPMLRPLAGRLYADGTGGPVTVPGFNSASATPWPGGPSGVYSIPISQLPTNLRQQVLAAQTLATNTGTGAGFTTTGGSVAVNAQGALVQVNTSGGRPSVTALDTTLPSAMAVFAHTDMSDPAAVQTSFVNGLALSGQSSAQGWSPAVGPDGQPQPLTAEQVTALQAQGYTVAVLDPVNGNAAVRPPGQSPTDIANIGASNGARPVYVVLGGPPLSTVDRTQIDNRVISPERRAELEKAVGDLNGLFPSAQAGRMLEGLTPVEQQVVIDAALARWPPPGGSELPDLVVTLVESAPPEAQAYATQTLYQRSQAATDPVVARSYATAAAQMASASPDAAAALLSSAGPEGMTALVDDLSLRPTEGENPAHAYALSGRSDIVGTLLAQVANLSPTPAQASFVFSVAQHSDASAWDSPTFRAGMAASLSTVMSLGDPEAATSEQARLGALFENPHIRQALSVLPEDQRSLLVIHLMDNPGLTAALVEEHQGNLATAQAYLDLQGLSGSLTGPFASGTAPLGPDGQPLIPPDATLVPPDAAVLQQHPEIAALGQPLTTAAIAEAVRTKKLSPAQAADFVEHLAEHSAQVADPSLAQYGVSPFEQGVIEALNGNPIAKSNTDDYAGLNADSLFAVADAIRGSTDPQFIAQAMVAASAQDRVFRDTLPRFAEAVAMEGDRTQASRQRAMAMLGMVASIAAPILVAQAIPLTASLSLGGRVLAGEALRNTAMVATSGVMSATLNAAGQYGDTGQVSWGHVALGSVTDMMGAYFGMRLTRNLVGVDAMMTAGSVDAAFGVASYALGTPGALEGLLARDPDHLRAALFSAGVSFVASTAFEGVSQYFRGARESPRGFGVEPAEVPFLGASNGFLEYGRADGALPVASSLNDPASLVGRIVSGLEAKLGDVEVRTIAPGESVIDVSTGQPLRDPISGDVVTVSSGGGYVDEKNGIIYLGPDANVNVLVHEASHAVFLSNRGHWGWGGGGDATPPTSSTLARMELQAYGKNIAETSSYINELTTRQQALNPTTQSAEYTRLSEQIATLTSDLEMLTRGRTTLLQQQPVLEQFDAVDAKYETTKQRMEEIRAETGLTGAELRASNPEYKQLGQEFSALQVRRDALVGQLEAIEAANGFADLGHLDDPRRDRYQVTEGPFARGPQDAYPSDPAYLRAQEATSALLTEGMLRQPPDSLETLFGTLQGTPGEPSPTRAYYLEAKQGDPAAQSFLARRTDPEANVATNVMGRYAMAGRPEYGGTIYERAVDLVPPGSHMHMTTVNVDGRDIDLTATYALPGANGQVNTVFWDNQPLSVRDQQAVMAHMEGLYEAANAPGLSVDERVRRVGELNWWLAQTAPFGRGSASAAEAITKALFDAHGIDVPPWKSGISPDLEAYVTPMEDYIDNYATYFETPPTG